MSFEHHYQKVQGIVHRARKDYFIKLWEKSDWDQEGMFTLYQLLQAHPGIEEDPAKLYTYFKVKFRNYIKDKVRRQESQKRKFDRMNHEDITELSHLVAEGGGMLSDDKVLLQDMLRSYRKQLSDKDQANYAALISGQRFKGRRQMLQDLRTYLADFRE